MVKRKFKNIDKEKIKINKAWRKKQQQAQNLTQECIHVDDHFDTQEENKRVP